VGQSPTVLLAKQRSCDTLNIAEAKKLKEFEEIAIEKAKKQRAQYLRELNKDIKNEAQKVISAAQSQSEVYVDNLLTFLIMEKNKEIAGEKMRLKRELADLRKEHEDKIFSAVKEKLDEFVLSPHYGAYLAEGIRRMLRYSNRFLLNKPDMVYKENFERTLYVEVLPSEEDFYGGFKAVTSNKNIVIDNSFKVKLDALREAFMGFEVDTI